MIQKGTATIGLVADLMLESRLDTLLGQRRDGFQRALDELARLDIATANLEMPLSTRGSKMLKYSNLRSDPAIIDDVRAMGFHAVSLANNHMMDYGPDALLDTLAACDRAGIMRCGAGANLAEAMAPVWLEAGGQRIAFISLSSTLPLGSEATDGTVGIAPVRVQFSLEVDTNLINEQPGTMPTVHSWARAQDRDAACAHIRDLAREADAVIVAIHWGVPAFWLSPYQGPLAEYQQPLGRAFIDAGADIVFGHHSHSLHGVEVYNGRPIIYSAGNFIFERPRAFMEPEAVIVEATFGEQMSIEFVPLMVDERGLGELATGETAAAVFEKLGALSAPFGTRFEIDGERARLLLG